MNWNQIEHRLRSGLRIASCTFFLFIVSSTLRAGEIIDRIVATVNGHIILQSDWGEDVRYEAFVDGRALDQISAEDRKAALDRLIDQELLRQQAQAATPWHPSGEDVTNAIAHIRQQLPSGKTGQLWRATLTSYGLAEADLKRRVVVQLELMHFVDTRLRPVIHVDSRNVESYYTQEFLPELLHSGSKPVPLATVSARVQELLTQQQINERLLSWIQQLRAASNIRADFRGHGE
jgi:peptidyl-prolyl cis-trans isomerase SurA